MAFQNGSLRAVICVLKRGGSRNQKVIINYIFSSISLLGITGLFMSM